MASDGKRDSIFKTAGGAIALAAAGAAALFRGGGRAAEHEAPAVMRAMARAEGAAARATPRLNSAVAAALRPGPGAALSSTEASAASSAAVMAESRTGTKLARGMLNEKAALSPTGAAAAPAWRAEPALVSPMTIAARADALSRLTAGSRALGGRVSALAGRLPPAVARPLLERHALSQARVAALAPGAPEDQVDAAAREQRAITEQVERLEKLYG
jgi:hypothetical protein